MPFPDLRAYEELVYGLQERYPGIQHSTLVLATIGPTLAKVEGQIIFEDEVIYFSSSQACAPGYQAPSGPRTGHQF